jgi:predicted flap endonuclease-1-like 5' DNA nuclease
MRDRLGWLVLPREPEPPPLPPAPDDLTSVRGIGPTYAARLQSAGITTYGGLASTDPAQVATLLGISTTRAREMVKAAGRLAGR